MSNSIITAIFTLNDEQFKEFLSIKDEILKLIKENEVNCFTYNINTLQEELDANKHTIFIYEVYKDQNAVDDHVKSAGFLKINDFFQKHNINVDIKFWGNIQN